MHIVICIIDGSSDFAQGGGENVGGGGGAKNLGGGERQGA